MTHLAPVVTGKRAPFVTDRTAPTAGVTATVPRALYNAFSSMADALRITKSELARSLIESYVRSAAAANAPEHLAEEVARLCDDRAALQAQCHSLRAQADALRDRLSALHAECDQLRRAREFAVGARAIQAAVCAHYRIELADLTGPWRGKRVMRPRWVAMYLCRVLTLQSLPQIGRSFGNRDHSSVLCGIRNIERALATEPALAAEIAELRKRLEAE